MEERVFIIKNKDLGHTNKIWRNANDSYCKNVVELQKEDRFYNVKFESIDANYLKGKNIKSGDKGIILLITYGNNHSKIQDVHIGMCQVTNDLNLKYWMYRYIDSSKCTRTIEGIIDKLDLNLNEDFPTGSYIRISKMNSLILELTERILSIQKPKKHKIPKYYKEHDYKLNKLAQHNEQCVRIYGNSKSDKYRNEFQRDRERIVNSKAFRRMVDKAQIFGADKGDYYRTRMTHTLEVNQIAKAISYALRLNLDLTEAIALAHDLGHTPFGHQGERTIDDILCGKSKIDFGTPDALLKVNCYGRFKHNYQSSKILTKLEEKYINNSGLDVSVQVIEGALKHTRLKEKIDIDDFLDKDYSSKMNIKIEPKTHICVSATLEGQVVGIEDEIAQRGHDVDDALTSGLMTIDELINRLEIEKCSELRDKLQETIKDVNTDNRIYTDKNELITGRIISDIVGFLINDVIDYSGSKMNDAEDDKIDMNNDTKYIEFSPKTGSINVYLEKIVQKKVICNTEVARCDYNASKVVLKLFEAYYMNPRLLHKGTLHRIFAETLMHEKEEVSNSAIDLNDGAMKIVNAEIDDMCRKAICDNEDEKETKEASWLEIYNNRYERMSQEDYVMFDKRKILIRNIVDYIAGMTDGYAISEYNRIE